jgi:uncharacterized protein YdaL
MSLLLAACLAFGALASIPAHAQANQKVLVLYDAPKDGNYEKMGFAYAIMLRNLLGHFTTNIDMAPVESYTAGTLAGYTTTFYIGAYYNNPVPAAFLNDVNTNTDKTIVWFRHNIWHLAWDPAFNFTARTGLQFMGLRGMNAQPSSSNPEPGFFDTVQYKNKSLKKYYVFDGGNINADPEAGQMTVVDPLKASAPVQVLNSKSAERMPYVTRAGKFWYFADVPLSYIGPRDRYLVLADMLHDILGNPLNVTTNNFRALVRLEDVGAMVSVSAMKTLTDYLNRQKIPFSVATIPFYRDPLGLYNGGTKHEVQMSAAANLKTALNYALARRGEIVMHGYTHQYNDIRNYLAGISGDDYEFWNIVNNLPVVEDSEEWATNRLRAGLHMLRSNNYNPVAWESPHYQGSAASQRAAAKIFPTTYQRAVYYTADNPNLTAASGRDFAVGQFFPYIINQDYYGQRVLPENLGNIEYYDPLHPQFPVYTAADLNLNADFATVVRDGFASFFFHPFWLEPAVNQPTAMADFQSVITNITRLGFKWTSPTALGAVPPPP